MRTSTAKKRKVTTGEKEDPMKRRRVNQVMRKYITCKRWQEEEKEEKETTQKTEAVSGTRTGGGGEVPPVGCLIQGKEEGGMGEQEGQEHHLERNKESCKGSHQGGTFTTDTPQNEDRPWTTPSGGEPTPTPSPPARQEGGRPGESCNHSMFERMPDSIVQASTGGIAPGEPGLSSSSNIDFNQNEEGAHEGNLARGREQGGNQQEVHTHPRQP